ncbi:MAG: methyltransferase [Candidatus Bathyarchaeia archaeon]
MNFKEKTVNHYFSRQPKAKPKFGIISTYLRGKLFEFVTSTGVFSRTHIDIGTRLLIESMILPEEGFLLDLGCGYGPVGIAAASFRPNLHVILVDVNKRAVKLALENAKRNNVEKNVEVRHGFLYKPVENRCFDTILSNPPISAGMKIVKLIITEAPKHLNKHGLFQIVVRSKIGGKTLRLLLENTFGNAEILARKSGYRVFLTKKQE